MPTLTELQDHITNTSALTWSKSNGDLRAMLNAPDAGTVDREVMSVGDFKIAALPLLEILEAVTDTAILAKWHGRIDFLLVGAGTTIRIGDPAVKAAIGQMSADIPAATPAVLNATLFQRSGSYAETIWGAGVTISIHAIRKARP